MSWMLNKKNPSYENWFDYFDVVIVDAKKPNFFLTKSEFREICINSGFKKLGHISKLEKGHIYCNGNQESLQALCGISAGNSVLYVGDHIFSDVMISKKKHAWRTLLIIPELPIELEMISKSKDQFKEVIELERELYGLNANISRLGNSDNYDQEIRDYKKKLKSSFEKLDATFNQYFGSMLKCKLQPSFFAMQISRYADLYSSSVVNLLYYSMAHRFIPISNQLPHEREILGII